MADLGNPNLGTQSKTGKSTDGNLDITQVADDDTDALASQIESFYKQDGTIKTRLAYNWDRNHRFLDGDQWLVFDGNRESGGVWNRLTVSKANEFLPRPVTNYIFDAYQTLKSYVIKVKPRSTVIPCTPLYDDRTAAKIGELCCEANWARLKEQENYEYAASCMITYGTVFKKDYWDASSQNLVTVPRMTQAPVTDPNTGMVMGMSEVPALDETGQPIEDKIPLGDVNTVICEPYRIALDPLATDLHKARWIMEYSIQSLDWLVETYSKEAPGYTNKVDDVKEEKSLSGSMRKFYQLKNSSGIKSGGGLEGAGGSSGQGGDAPLTNSAVVKEYYEAPSSQHPDGRMVVVANGVCLFAGASPYKGPDMGDWHPYSDCRWELVPGRYWGKSPLDVGVELQKRINSIDAVITLTRKTMAIPQKLIPMGSGVPNGHWTGRPGQEIHYRVSGEAKPETIPAAGVDASVFKEREQCVEDLKNITGAIDILKGDRPPGVTAASALNMLYEVGTGKLFPILDRWKRFTENSQRKQLRMICERYKEPRPEYIRLLKAMNKELSEQDINKFIGADLKDNCNVSLEASSNVPKLQAARQAQLLEAAQVGSLALEQPENRAEFNRQMGIQGFNQDVGPDTTRADWENSNLDSIDRGGMKPVVLDVDDDKIHMAVLARRMKEPSWMSASPAVQQAYMGHYQEHMQADNQKTQMAQMEAAMTGAPQGPQQGGGAPQPVHPHGKGIPQAQSKMLRSDTAVPGAPGGSQ